MTARVVADGDLVADVVYLTVLWTSAVAAWIGATRAPVQHRLIGRLVAGGISLTAVGDTLWAVIDGREEVSGVSVADPVWLFTYVLLCCALTIVVRRSVAGRQNVDFAIDAATIVVVCVLVLWSTSIDTIVADPDLASTTRVVRVAYPIADAVLLALVIRVLTSRAARSSLAPLFGVGVILWLAADLAYVYVPGGQAQVLIDTAWMAAPALMARSVWHLGDDVPAPYTRPPHGRPILQLVIAIGPLFVPPALDLVAHLNGRSRTPYALVVGAAVLVLLAFVRTARLVTALGRARRELEQAHDDALEAYRAKSMFLATMSHEIRTPLTMVLGAGELLEDTDLDDFQRDMVRRVQRSGTVLRSLVDVVLDYSRLEAGRYEVQAAPVDLRQMVDTVAATYGPCAQSRGVALECVIDPGVPAQVVSDPGRLVTLLGNLLDNAAKFTPEGRIQVTVRCAERSLVELVVEDTGIGIPEEHLSSIFESFTQVDSSTTRHHGGIGLGLAICHRVADSMGGTISVTSRPGAGSTFVVRLPLVPVDERTDHPGQAALPTLGLTTTGRAP